MLDANGIFTNGVAITANGNSSAVNQKKTGADGVPVQVVVTAVSGTSPTLAVKVQESDDNSTYNDVVVFPSITATGRYHRLVQSKKAYLRLNYVVGGTSPSFTVTAGIASGAQRDQTA